jgi:Asp-tRNA(Asn)/Glu-tRNA(Gln) amidotransferase A subunit family amidase
MTDRRELLAGLVTLGVGTLAFQRSLVAEVLREEPAKPVLKTITPEMVEQSEWVAGITLTEADRKTVAAALTQSLGRINAARKRPVPNSLAPAIQFNPTMGIAPPVNGPGVFQKPKVEGIARPKNDDDLAFLDILSLGGLLRNKKITSVELTKFFLARLKKYDPKLLCVTNLTEDLAINLATRADHELVSGKDRGLLHGIPWGAKDLISVPGYPTTWGAEHYKKQVFDTTATVAKKLDEAGAVLVAKLTLGALAMGDVWYGGMTRNPWNTKQGSSGSSAGSCSAVVAGLVPFAIGSETLGSIVSPSTRCGATGLRPTFGRVSRAGCMTLCWTMDKLGPICRSVGDAAIVFDAILGANAGDPPTVSRKDYGFSWPGDKKFTDLTVGYVEGRTKADDREELKELKKLGVKLKEIKLPQELANTIVMTILDVECAAAFDELPRNGIRDGYGEAWRTTFQSGQFVTAVEYLRANRLRTQLCEAMAEVFKSVDLYVGGNDLAITNLTGHPTVCLPNGFIKNGDVEVPKALTFTGKLYEETTLMQVAGAYQTATGHHLKHPKLD